MSTSDIHQSGIDCHTCGAPIAGRFCAGCGAESGHADTVVLPPAAPVAPLPTDTVVLPETGTIPAPRFTPGWYADVNYPGYERRHDGMQWSDEWREAAMAQSLAESAVRQPGVTPVAPQAHSVVVSSNSAFTGGEVVLAIVAWGAALISFGYMLPWAIAATTRKNQVAVFLLNLLLGWTVIGWLVALVMAFVGNNDRGAPLLVSQQANPTVNVYLANPPAGPVGGSPTPPPAPPAPPTGF